MDTNNLRNLTSFVKEDKENKTLAEKKPQSLFLWDLGFRTTSARLKSKSLRKK